MTEKALQEGVKMTGTHIVNGQFQSDKYPTTPPGKVPLSVKDPMAQPLLWEYAQRRRSVDAQFSSDLEWALTKAGYQPDAITLDDALELEPVEGDPACFNTKAEAIAAWNKRPDAPRLVELSNLSPDVIRLVIAARCVAFGNKTPYPSDMIELDGASEAFADRVPWEDEPEETS